MDAIVTQGLARVYREIGKRSVHSLRGVDLTVHEGEVYGFLGRNGAGKTTTIKILCGLLKASRGEAFLFGENVRSRAARRHFGYLPEHPYFYEYLTPRETLDFYGQLQGQSAAQRASEWKRLSDLLDLHGIAEQRIKGFSKGMRQRLGFAAALTGDPPLLILDEPMSGLDPLGRRMIRELIRMQRDKGKTIFFSSHVLGDVEQICDRAGVLVRGRLTREGSVGELTEHRIDQIEAQFRELPETAAKQLEESAGNRRHIEDTDLFVFADAAAADEAVRKAQAAGGKLLAFTPVRESLESWFMRHQENTEGAA
jgi:ABC-2 type transport system ATP-binding protein